MGDVGQDSRVARRSWFGGHDCRCTLWNAGDVPTALREAEGSDHGRGIPTEEILEELRQSRRPVRYLVGRPKGRLTRLENRRWPIDRAGSQTRNCGSNFCPARENSMCSAESGAVSARKGACAGVISKLLETPGRTPAARSNPGTRYSRNWAPRQDRAGRIAAGLVRG